MSQKKGKPRTKTIEKIVAKKVVPARKSARRAKPLRNARSQPVGPSIRIRMYRVGFGDAFLLFLPTSKGEKKVLFDCGSIKADGGFTLQEIVQAIVRDVTEADGIPRIDIVVATHRHKDHVSGFANAMFSEVEAKEVWMPWTEDPTDPIAAEIRERQSRLALALEASLTLQMAAKPSKTVEHNPVQSLYEMVMNALSNERAMAVLHDGFLPHRDVQEKTILRRFLSSGDRQFRTKALPNVTVHILGPSKDRDVIAEMDPPIGKSYLMLSSAGGNQQPTAPFGSDWAIATSDEEWQGFGNQLSAEEMERIKGFSDDLDSAVAAALDSAVNGTSLMLVLEVGGTFLLFPGDAQWGTWKMALEEPRSRALLGKTVFYKVGHHASHNATPIPFVEECLDPGVFWGGMASIGRVASWPSIPREELIEALLARSDRIVRSDSHDDLPSGFTNHDEYVEASVPIRALS